MRLIMIVIALLGIILAQARVQSWSTTESVVLALAAAAWLSLVIWHFRKAKRQRRNSLHTQYLASPITEIASFRRSQPDILREFARARRYQRILAVMVLRLNPIRDLSGRLLSLDDETSREPRIKASKKNYELLEFLIIGAILRDGLRASDITTYDAPNSQFIIILPEVTKEQTLKVVGRLKGLFYDKILAQIQGGIAEYPQDGLIIEDLVKYALKHKTSIPAKLNKKTVHLDQGLLRWQVEIY